MELRILILAPYARNAAVLCQTLNSHGYENAVCEDIDGLVQELGRGAAAGLVTEEALIGTPHASLSDWVEQQPAWSDFPFVLLAGRQLAPRSATARRIVRELGNVIVLERPIGAETLISAIDSAMRARRRQYQARADILEREQARDTLRRSEEALKQLNENLESLVSARTADLSKANDRLLKEIAQRERAQAALVQAQKMEAIGQLTGGIAHDFNNLLTAIVGNVDLIRRRSPDERVRRLAGYAHEAASRASRLTGQLLAFSRSQRLNLKPIDIDQLIEGMSDLIPRSLGPSINVSIDCQSGGLRAIADADQLELAILNLIINARDAMAEGGSLTIETELRSSQHNGLAAGKYLVISIADTGGGIPAHLLEKVFEPFFTTKPVGKGTGLGLSQVYGFSQQCGGTTRISSTPGRGTRVEIWLPAAHGDTESAHFDGGDLPLVNSINEERILLVEDDLDVRRFIGECLVSLGYSVTTAADGRSALDLLERQHADLLIVDFAMPGMNGAQFADEVRAREQDTPIVFATGYADMAAIDRVKGPKFVLRKPFEVSGLANVIQEALACREGGDAVLKPHRAAISRASAAADDS